MDPMVTSAEAVTRSRFGGVRGQGFTFAEIVTGESNKEVLSQGCSINMSFFSIVFSFVS